MDYLSKLNYHFKPEKGWVNDPNGLVYYKGWYHIFYQHNPNSEKNDFPMYWGHARTKNFIEWEELPVAVVPGAEYDADSCWSGTATVKDGVLYLLYSSVIDNGEENTPRWLQTVSVAYSADGINFEKYENNPVISSVPADGDAVNFRDPAVMYDNGKYYCAMATGNKETKTARLLLYKSDDVLNWEYDGVLAQWDNGLCAECPSFASFADGYLLTASVLYPDYKHNFTLMYGDFKDGKFTIKSSAEISKGPDQYAGQMFRDHLGRNILISWIPGWGYEAFAEKNIGCMSLPCEVKINDGKLTVYPVEEVRHLLKDSDASVKITEEGFSIARDGRESVEYKGEIRDLKILRDEYVVEVFVNGGEELYTAIL